jgi:hypothetical protein
LLYPNTQFESRFNPICVYSQLSSIDKLFIASSQKHIKKAKQLAENRRQDTEIANILEMEPLFEHRGGSNISTGGY